jgi:stage II sporulation protein D
MKTLFFACLLVGTLAGCAEIQPASDPFYFSAPSTAPMDNPDPAQPHPRIRVAIVVRQSSVHLSAPESFVLTGFSLEGTPETGDSHDRLLREITLTTNQIDGKRALLIPMGEGQIEVDHEPYRGSVEILDNGDGTLTVVNDVDLEDYVMGVVGGEVPKNWPLEALKAQAIAARTFAVLKHQEAVRANNPYDLENTALFQMYKGSGTINDNIRKAVLETDEEIITYNNQPIEAFFHSNCGGETSGSMNVWSQDKPYLQSVICDYCRTGAHFHWKTEVLITDMIRELRAAGLKIGDVSGLKVLARDDSGRIAVLGVMDADGGLKSIKSNAFRMALGPDIIRSTRFEAQVKNDRVVFNGLGWGHGVGMCQEGACGMARKGYNAYEIIRHYYRGVLVEKLRAH